MTALTILHIKISKSKIRTITVNPKTTSYVSFRQHLSNLNFSCKFQNDLLALISGKWVEIRSEFDWQEIIQTTESHVFLKIQKESRLVKSTSWTFKNGQGVSGMIKKYEQDVQTMSYQANLEKLRELGFTNSVNCEYLLVKYRNDFKMVCDALRKREIKNLPPLTAKKPISEWIKVSKEPMTKLKVELEPIVKDKIEQYKSEDTQIFHLGFGKEVDGIDRDGAEKLIQMGFEEDLVLFFMKKRGNDFDIVLMDLNKTKLHFN